ncbi:hypothetical protein ACHHYP_09960 [Achlya hypogyna]|uniref:Secreted protein n=1 Tax=Achlya hypogyna TaxID=1202772 RepID=A0A1V9YM42_ACHHY|nr:hypothetical protein ACHHYP_09960 [Achlya hypogyna]
MGWTRGFVAAGLALLGVSSVAGSDLAQVAQPTCGIDVPWEETLAEPQWKQCYTCWKSVWYVKATHALGNVSDAALAKGTRLTCSWIARSQSSPACAKITDNVPKIVANLTAGHKIGEICRSLDLCKKRKAPAEPRTLEHESKRKLCFWGVKYVNASQHIEGLPEKAIEIGLKVTCPHCPHYRKFCHKLVHSVPAIIKELKSGQSCAKAICKKLHIQGRKVAVGTVFDYGEDEFVYEEYDDDDAEYDEEDDDEALEDHGHKRPNVVTVGVIFLTVKMCQRPRAAAVDAEYVAVPQQS